ncbi:hypothetical protein K492DRAFT_234766 [Lichtheimia hyalospora FSU 10163]|nr:hypothetical protein K492DRAFT_234766 [Lichtheimia hyalospora FSU 10163]
MESNTSNETTAPGEWEITKDTTVDTTVEEKVQENENPEDAQAQEQLTALDELPNIMNELEKDATRYDLHVKLIETLKGLNMPEYLQDAREAMHKLYPLTESMWLDWINDTKSTATDTDGVNKVLSLYEKASEDYLSIPIWKSFVDYVLELFDNQWDNEDRVNDIRVNLKRAVQATKWHISKSQEIWEPFIQFQVKWLEHLKSPSSEQLEQVTQDYFERLCILHTDHESTFSQYSTFNTTWDNANYEKNMVKANKVYSKTKEAMNECDYFELKLSESNYSLDMFYQYIENMKLKDKPMLNYIQNLYERAVALYCTDVGLWDDYIVFLLERARVPVVMGSVTRRAIRNCPWSGVLWAHYARSLEARNANHEDILAVFDAGQENETLVASQEDLICLLLAKCDYYRRRVNMESADTNDDELRLEQVEELRMTIYQCIVYHQEKFQPGDPYFRLERYASYVESELFDNYEGAKEIWEGVVKKFGKSVEAWLAYIQFERSKGNSSQCESLFKRAIAKQPDDPERLMHAWLTMEHEIGSLDSMQDALVRMNKKTKLLTREWQAAYALEEARQEQEAEKAIREKQKKAQHRQKLKQNKKQAQSTEQPSRASAKRKAADMDKNAPTETEHPPQVDTVDDTTAPTATESSYVEQDNNATPTSPTETKRRRVETNQEETTSNRSGGRGGRGRGRGRERGRGYQGPARHLGRGVGRAGRLAMPSTRSTKQNEEATVTESTAQEEPAKPKSQDDFRAMLLGKK